MGGFSFQESKTLAAGEGGIVLTDNDELADRARLIHNIGRVVGKPGYEHYILSSNYRMTEFQAALLLSKLEKLPQEIEKKHSNGEYLASKLRKIGGAEPLRRDSRITKRGYYFFVIRYDSEDFEGLPREKFLQCLNAEGVPAGPVYGMPLYRQPAFKKENLKGVVPKGAELPDYEGLRLPGSEEFIMKEIAIPHPVLMVERTDIDMIVSSIEKIKENLSEIHLQPP